MTHRFVVAFLVAALLAAVQAHADEPRIDRRALVTRHNPSFTAVDPSAPLMIGNGDIAFTADITGLQTFPEQYSSLVPLITQAQWAWHSFPNPKGYKLEDSLVPIEVRGKKRPYPWLKDWSEASKPHIAWLRENPHRFSLGRVSLHLVDAEGKAARFADLSNTSQSLDMWTGTLSSHFDFGGERVEVETRVHPELDMLIVTLRSLLIARQQLGIDLKFPGVNTKLNPDPADWSKPDSHQTKVLKNEGDEISLERRLDDTRYHVRARADRDITSSNLAPHHFRLVAAKRANELTLSVAFSEETIRQALPSAASSKQAVSQHWERYWSTGGVVDFSGSTDERARELERRVVLSQYLMALNAAGTLPPQEEGLFSNSWNGKFHMEMHLWHAGHFATWGRTDLLERSMPWYLEHLPQAKARAQSHGLKGAWWPKMVGPEGRESPSTINPFIMWQQPHPIYLAELIYRDRNSSEVLSRYKDLVFETAELLASFVHFDDKREAYVLGPPIVPVQEVFPPLDTFNPTFELEYYRFGIETAQLWRTRLGMARNESWDEVLAKLSPLPQRDGLYLATESFPELWEQARSKTCSEGRTGTECWNRDHPSFVGALGVLPGRTVDVEIMRSTLRAVEKHWDLRQTWGWDFPLLAMTAARLKEPEKAIDFLFYPSKNNQFGTTGMTPRVHFEAHADHFVPGADSAVGVDGPGYRRAAETYFPSNGSLLFAIGLMAGGWDGESSKHPGFPKNGKWVVRSEGLKPLP
jgi:hypothetical protein